VASYDVAVNYGNNSPIIWSLEASVDGMTWDEVDRVDVDPFSSAGWAFARKTYTNGSGATHTGGHAIAGATNKTEQAISRYCPVSVASGATLKCVGTAEIANLSVDFTGAGTISGFNFATDGTIEVLNVPKGGGAIPLTFADTDPAEVAKIAGWKLSSDGKFKLSASGGLLRIFPYGTLFLVR